MRNVKYVLIMVLIAFLHVNNTIAQTTEKNSSLNVSKPLNLGNGFYFANKMGTHYMMNGEVGYLWKTSSEPDLDLGDDYIGNRSDYRYGVSLGFQYFKNEPLRLNNQEFQSKAYAPYVKFKFGSPVLLNFMSVSSHLKVLYAMPAENSKHGIKDENFAIGFGYDLEFWITENKAITIGYNDESDRMFAKNKKHSFYPEKVRFTFGFKSFF